METEQKRNARKTRVGVVVSDKMQKSVVVMCESRVPHSRYGKIIKRTSRIMAHDEENTCGVGDVVLVMETRPLSKLKNWIVKRIIEKAK